MTRKMYELTQKQIEKIQNAAWSMPSDDEIKAQAQKEHRPWGLVKRDIVLRGLKFSTEYIRGLGQGMVDKASGLEYSEERSDNHYNLGYYRGYTDYESNRHGWDANTRREFDEKYVN